MIAYHKRKAGAAPYLCTSGHPRKTYKHSPHPNSSTGFQHPHPTASLNVHHFDDDSVLVPGSARGLVYGLVELPSALINSDEQCLPPSVLRCHSALVPGRAYHEVPDVQLQYHEEVLAYQSRSEPDLGVQQSVHAYDCGEQYEIKENCLPESNNGHYSGVIDLPASYHKRPADRMRVPDTSPSHTPTTMSLRCSCHDCTSVDLSADPRIDAYLKSRRCPVAACRIQSHAPIDLAKHMDLNSHLKHCQNRGRPDTSCQCICCKVHVGPTLLGEDNNYHCPAKRCCVKVKKMTDLRRHTLVAHCKNPPRYPCTEVGCKYGGNNGFIRWDKLNSHRRNVHEGKVRPGKANRRIEPKLNGKGQVNKETNGT